MEVADTAYVFVPDNCKTAGSNCKFMIVSHGKGGRAEAMAKNYAPCAAPYDIIMLFPQVVPGWDETGYTGPLYDTRDGLHSIFFRKIIE